MPDQPEHRVEKIKNWYGQHRLTSQGDRYERAQPGFLGGYLIRFEIM